MIWDTLTKVFTFFACYFLNVHLHHSSRINSHKKSQNSRNQGCSYYFCLMIEGSASVPLTLTYGSGSRRPKNLRVLRNTGGLVSRRYIWWQESIIVDLGLKCSNFLMKIYSNIFHLSIYGPLNRILNFCRVG
jgi:hypothetical protein